MYVTISSCKKLSLRHIQYRKCSLPQCCSIVFWPSRGRRCSSGHFAAHAPTASRRTLPAFTAPRQRCVLTGASGFHSFAACAAWNGEGVLWRHSHPPRHGTPSEVQRPRSKRLHPWLKTPSNSSRRREGEEPRNEDTNRNLGPDRLQRNTRAKHHQTRYELLVLRRSFAWDFLCASRCSRGRKPSRRKQAFFTCRAGASPSPHVGQDGCHPAVPDWPTCWRERASGPLLTRRRTPCSDLQNLPLVAASPFGGYSTTSSCALRLEGFSIAALH